MRALVSMLERLIKMVIRAGSRLIGVGRRLARRTQGSVFLAVGSLALLGVGYLLSQEYMFYAWLMAALALASLLLFFIAWNQRQH